MTGLSIGVVCEDDDLEGFGSDYPIHVNKIYCTALLPELTCNGNMCFCKKILALVCTAARTLS
jgi:hypothetical protein